MNRTLIAALSAGLMLAGAAQVMAQDARRSPAATRTNPSWASVPTLEDMEEAFPTLAGAMRLDADVDLQCVAQPDGDLGQCRVMSATPEGLGFERAGLALSSRFRVNPGRINGEPVPSSVAFRVRFRSRAFEVPAPWTGAEPDPERLAAMRAIVDAAASELEEDFWKSMPEREVAPERRAKVQAMMRQTHAEFAERRNAAAALALARVFTPEEFMASIRSGEEPAGFSEEMIERAGDVIEQAEQSAALRMRQLYCAEFECPTLPPPPGDAGFVS